MTDPNPTQPNPPETPEIAETLEIADTAGSPDALDLLLDAALAPVDPPRDLAARIFAKTTDPADAEVERVLDEALVAPEAPAYLASQVVERTRPGVDASPVVLGRITPGWLRLAAAVALAGTVLAVVIAAAMRAEFSPQSPTVVQNIPTPIDPASTSADANDDDAALWDEEAVSYALADLPLDVSSDALNQRIDLLALEADLAWLEASVPIDPADPDAVGEAPADWSSSPNAMF